MTGYIRWAAVVLALANMALMIWSQPELQEIVLVASISLLLVQCARVGSHWLNPFFLFALTATIFLSGRVVASLMSQPQAYMVGDWFYFGPLDPRCVALTLGAIGSFYCGICLALKCDELPVVALKDEAQLRFSLTALALLAPIFLYRANENIEIYRAADYLSQYLYGGPSGFIYKLGGWFILPIFGAIAARPNRVLACMLAVLGLVVCVLESIAGARGIALAYLVMLCWLLVTVLEIRVKGYAFVLASLALLLFADFMGRARTGIESETDIFSLVDLVRGFIFSQGTTMLFLVGVADNLDKFSLFDAFKASFALPSDLFSDNAGLQDTASLAHRVAMQVNSEMYARGMGIGGSAVGEAMLYSVYLGPLVAGILTAFIMRITYRVAHMGAGGLMWFSYTFAFIILLPRENQFYFVVPGIKALMFWLMLFMVKKSVNEKIRS